MYTFTKYIHFAFYYIYVCILATYINILYIFSMGAQSERYILIEIHTHTCGRAVRIYLARLRERERVYFGCYIDIHIDIIESIPSTRISLMYLYVERSCATCSMSS